MRIAFVTTWNPHDPGIWAGTGYKLYHRLIGAPRLALPTEGVMLWVVLVGLITFAALRPSQRGVAAAANVGGEERATARPPRLR